MKEIGRASAQPSRRGRDYEAAVAEHPGLTNRGLLFPQAGSRHTARAAILPRLAPRLPVGIFRGSCVHSLRWPEWRHVFRPVLVVSVVLVSLGVSGSGCCRPWKSAQQVASALQCAAVVSLGGCLCEAARSSTIDNTKLWALSLWWAEILSCPSLKLQPRGTRPKHLNCPTSRVDPKQSSSQLATAPPEREQSGKTTCPAFHR
jgi:hypothetical protein